jgi:hypothetical protein
MRRLLINNELERVWKEAVLALLQVLPQHLPGGTDKTTKTLIQDKFTGRDFNWMPLKHEAGGASLSVEGSSLLSAQFF